MAWPERDSRKINQKAMRCIVAMIALVTAGYFFFTDYKRSP
jgi:hypothetical protein